MKQRFNTLDLQVALHELSVCFSGCRVTNVYDINNKTYLIKLHKPDSKAIVLIESGIRIHCTDFDWPKNMIPSGFSMKLRKHLRSRRLEKVSQVGVDRIADLQFGSGEAAYHLIVELYDKGNILLTDYEFTIISVLRPRTDENSDVKFTVREKYPFHLAKQNEKLTLEKVKELICDAKQNEDLKKILTFNLSYGAPLIEHCLSIGDFPDKCIIDKNFNRDDDIEKLFNALLLGEKIIEELKTEIHPGFIVTKITKAIKLELEKNKELENEELVTYDEFHPYLFKKFESASFLEFPSFDKAVDEFFSKLESQKSEIKEHNQNKEAVKKLENVKKDHQRRLEELKLSQTEDEIRASLIEYNLDLVDKAIYLVNNAIANQMDWAEIHEIIKEAQEEEHEVALAIKELKLEINHIVLELEDSDFDDGVLRRKVEIDLGMNAFRNSRRYYESKKHSIIKENKTVDAGDKALKSAEKKTFELLKQASKIKTIGKSRKQYWFEKFFWFISSENYLVIGGRDQQQNEIVVKRYLKSGDLYVHADVQGASSVIIKNPSGNPVPPKTLNEAGCMAVCYSVAWEAKVLTSAYWVYHNQVSKQAPSGEYLKTGSFMIRGKKNFIPQTALVFGLGVLYKLDDNSVFRHKDERKIKTSEEEINELNVEYEELSIVEEDEEITSEKAISDLNIENVVDKQDDNRPETESKKSEESLKECEQTRKKESENQFPDTSFQIKLVSNINSAEDSFKTEEITAKENNDRQQEKSTTGPVSSAESNKGKSQPLKRGQKSRLEKMKTKYKDQDEEDRELIMQYLSPAGKPTKTDEKSIKSNEKSKLKGKQIDKSNKKNCQQLQQKPKEKQSDSNVAQYSKLAPDSTNSISKITQIEGNQESNANLNVNEDLEIEEDNTQDEIDVIDSLTGIPLDEDEILFCLTVCAPYSTLQNYKHKVKLIPGTSKRGQVVKTTIEMFNRDKVTTQREKDLIKSNLVSKEQDISRNLPGKVKLSAPNLNKLKKK